MGRDKLTKNYWEEINWLKPIEKRLIDQKLLGKDNQLKTIGKRLIDQKLLGWD